MMFGPHIVELLGVIGIFMVRFGVPLLISAGIAWWLIRLDRRWQREAPQVRPFVANSAQVAAPDGRIISEPCWVYRACPEETRNNCPAYTQPEIPCWLARLRNDGRLARNCRCCSIFATCHTTAAPAAAAD